MNEDFTIYTVPGTKNLFNDFHTREGAPGPSHFYSLAEHAADVESKLTLLENSVAVNDNENNVGVRVVQQNLLLCNPDETVANTQQPTAKETRAEQPSTWNEDDTSGWGEVYPVPNWAS